MGDGAEQYINYARQLASFGYFNKAFDMYLLAFEKDPSSKTQYEPEFRLTLTELNKILVNTSRYEDVFHNFGRAIDAFPKNIYLLNEIGTYLYKFEFYYEALSHFEKAVSIDSGYVDAEKNINSIKNLLVERWHFRMLNDKTRNEAYRAAIHEMVSDRKVSVLDVGTGCGLLSLYAHECAPLAITACDGSEVMIKMADCIFEDNHIKDILSINKMSTDMDYRDIGGKRSLLVTELFDAGLFGEHILKTLVHAKEYLLTNVAKVIPGKAEFFIVGAKCDHLSMKYKLFPSAKALLNIPHINAHAAAHGETYDCADVHAYKDIQYVTEAQSVLKVDFNNDKDIHDKLNRIDPFKVALKAKESNEINIFIGWFNLYLTENITLTTNPVAENRANAWQQAVFFDSVPISIKKNEFVSLEFFINGEQMIMAQNHENILKISTETIRFLNDVQYTNMIKRCIGMACVYLGQIADISQINLIDLCPFPLFGLLMLKRGAQSLVCCANTEADQKFFENVFKANDIPLTKITILLGHDWTMNTFGNEKYHAIFCNHFDLLGEIDMHKVEVAQCLENSHLIQGGLFLPCKITIMGQLVNSLWFDNNNRLNDENVSNYQIAKYINKYQVTQNFDIDFSNLDYTCISEPAVLGFLSNKMTSRVINVPVAMDGEVNAILCWYKIQLMKDSDEISTIEANSFIEGMAFIANPKMKMIRGEVANVLRCVDPDGAFKLMIEVEAN